MADEKAVFYVRFSSYDEETDDFTHKTFGFTLNPAALDAFKTEMGFEPALCLDVFLAEIGWITEFEHKYDSHDVDSRPVNGVDSAGYSVADFDDGFAQSVMSDWHSKFRKALGDANVSDIAEAALDDALRNDYTICHAIETINFIRLEQAGIGNVCADASQTKPMKL